MNTRHRTALGAAALLGLLGLGLWTMRTPDMDPSPAAAVAHPTDGGITTQTGGPTDAELTATLELVEHTLATWRGLHAPQGRLSLAETQALIAERDATAEALADAIGRLPAADIAGAHQAWRDATHTRDKLLIIDGLGRSPHGEAVDALEEIYDAGEGYTNRSHVLRALGDSPAPGHNDLLTEQMTEASDERLSQLAAQALHGEAEAAGSLAAAVDSELPIKTRLEAIHSLGGTGTDAARAALAAFAGDDSMGTRVQQYAQKELERSFGG